MNGNENLISVILPTYNGATRGNGEYLKQAIESVLNQTYENFELIIVNDGSIDDTEEVIKQYKDNRIIYIKNDSNRGVYSARNKGLINARGEYIAFLDDDDYYYTNKLKDQLDFMMNNKSYISLSDMDIINANGIKYSTLKNKRNSSQVKDICKGNISPAPSALMFKRDIIYDIGYFKEYLKAAADFDYILRVAIKYNINIIPITLNAYRSHKYNISTNIEITYVSVLFIVFELQNILLLFYNNNKNAFFYDVFFRYMKWRYDCNNFHAFRYCFKVTKIFGKIDKKWYFKYYLSYFTPILLILKKIRHFYKKND